MKIKLSKDQIDKLKISIESEIRNDILKDLENRKVRLDSESIDFILGKAKELIESNIPRIDQKDLVISLLKEVKLSEHEKQLAHNRELIWTREVRTDFIDDVLKHIKQPEDGKPGKKGDKGEKGTDGKDYVLTDQDKLDIAESVNMKGVVKEDLFNARYLQLIKDLQSGKIRLPAHGSGKQTGQEIVTKINEYLGSTIWQLPTQQQINQITQSLSTGLISGMKLSINTDTTKFNISAGSGYIVDNTTDPDNPTVTRVVCDEITGVSVTDIATQLVTYISMDADCNVVQSSEIPEEVERRENIYIGVLVHTNNTTIEAVNNTPTLAIDTDAQLQDLMNSLGLFNIEGNAIRPYSTDLRIQKSIGAIFKVGGNFQTNPKMPHRIDLAAQAPITSIQYRTQTGATYNPSGVLDPGYYDVAGTRTALANVVKASNQRVYTFPSGLIRIQYGQVEYASLAAAVEGLATENFVEEQNLKENGLLLCTISLRAGATNLALDTDARFLPAGKWGQSSNTGSTAVGTLQQIYQNSVTKPQIVITSELDGVEVSDENDTGLAVARFGKISAGNYTEFEADGSMEAKGTATMYRDFNIGGVSLNPGAANQPTLINLDTSTILVYAFSPTLTNAAHGAFEIDHNYKSDSDIVPHFHFYPTTANAGNVVLFFEYYIRNDNLIKLTGTLQGTFAVNGVAWEEIRASFSPITGTGVTFGSQMHVRVGRIGGDAADTYPDQVAMGTAGAHVIVNTMGSRTVSTK